MKRAVAIKQRIEKLERDLASIVDQNATPGLVRGGHKRRRTISPAARAKIAAAARARWARYRATKAKK